MTLRPHLTMSLPFSIRSYYISRAEKGRRIVTFWSTAFFAATLIMTTKKLLCYKLTDFGAGILLKFRGENLRNPSSVIIIGL